MARHAARDSVAATEHQSTETPLRVAFVVGMFPLVSETFIVDQVAQLLDRGVSVEIYSFVQGDEAHVSRKYFDYEMASLVRHLHFPPSKLARVMGAPARAIRLGRRHPRVLLRALNAFRFGRSALSLRLLYWAAPMAGREFDVVHCHFGTTAHDFALVRDVVGRRAPLVTTFYGVDVSLVFRQWRPDYYDRLKRQCSLYFVMSDDMRRRVVAHGFPADLVRVHPVGVEVDRYRFRPRALGEGEALRLAAVGRFVEKKGFDDLLRALAIVKRSTPRQVHCTLVGGGPQEEELRSLRESLGLENVVSFAGFLSVEDVVELLDTMHLLVAPSKTAADGDME